MCWKVIFLWKYPVLLKIQSSKFVKRGMLFYVNTIFTCIFFSVNGFGNALAFQTIEDSDISSMEKFMRTNDAELSNVVENKRIYTEKHLLRAQNNFNFALVIKK